MGLEQGKKTSMHFFFFDACGIRWPNVVSITFIDDDPLCIEFWSRPAKTGNHPATLCFATVTEMDDLDQSFSVQVFLAVQKTSKVNGKFFFSDEREQICRASLETQSLFVQQDAAAVESYAQIFAEFRVGP